MSQPESHGYPDWGRYAAGSDKVVYFDTSAIAVSGESYGPFFVGDSPYLGVTLTPNTNAARFELSFWQTSAVSGFMGDYYVDCQPATSFNGLIASQGPWLLITANTPVVGGLATKRIWSSHSMYGSAWLPLEGSMISRNGAAVGAGATVLTQAGRVRPGPAVWNVFSALATWTAWIDVVDYLGNLTRLDTITQAQGNASRSLFLPPANVRFNFQNTTGAAGNFSGSVMNLPAWPGS